MLRFVPPAGTPLEIREILSALKMASWYPEATTNLLASFAERLQVRYVFPTCSGRMALFLILQTLHQLRPDRSVVAIPAYTCYSVPASIVRTGLKLYPVEMDLESLDFDFSHLAALPEEGVLCILTSNLFGLMNNVPRIRSVARIKGAFVVDDAAQSIGASRNGELSGTLGDAGFYSFARGKALAVMAGGLIVTNSDEIAQGIQTRLGNLRPPSFTQSTGLLLEMLANWIFLDPRFYWIPNSLPFLRLGRTEFDPIFPMNRASKLSCALLLQLVERLEEMNQIRRRNAMAIACALDGNTHFTVPRPALDCRPTFIRFPVIARDEATRHRVLIRLQQAGIGASSYYPSAICDIPGIDSHMAPGDFHRPQAEALARRLLTLPTHPLVQERDLECIKSVLTRL